MSIREPTLRAKLLHAQRLSREEFASALTLAEEVAREADAAADGPAALQAVAVQGEVLLSQGLVSEACALVPRLEAATAGHGDPAAAAAAETFRAQLAFFMGAYREAIGHANDALALSDEVGDPHLRLVTRRGTCIVLGNLEVSSLPDIVAERLELAVAVGDAWEQAVARNDRACTHMAAGDLDAALAELDRADRIATGVTGPRLVVQSVLGATRSQVLVMAGRAGEAAELAIATVRALELARTPHSYLLGMASMVAMQALAAAGRVDEAVTEGRQGVERLGDSLPLTRSAILGSLAGVLRQAGRTEEAFDALEGSVTLERVAARQFIDLQHDLARAVAARHVADDAARRFRDAAERDWLTGLYNRRYLANLDLSAAGSVGVAMVDLDQFKAVNDTHGHEVGDRVLKRVAELLLATARGDDIVARLGGDEFVVLIRDADGDKARTLAERLHRRLAEEPWSRLAPDTAVGMSVGYAAASGSLDDLIAQADRHLYGAKRAGRGRIAGASAPG